MWLEHQLKHSHHSSSVLQVIVKMKDHVKKRTSEIIDNEFLVKPSSFTLIVILVIKTVREKLS